MYRAEVTLYNARRPEVQSGCFPSRLFSRTTGRAVERIRTHRQNRALLRSRQHLGESASKLAKLPRFPAISELSLGHLKISVLLFPFLEVTPYSTL